MKRESARDGDVAGKRRSEERFHVFLERTSLMARSLAIGLIVLGFGLLVCEARIGDVFMTANGGTAAGDVRWWRRFCMLLGLICYTSLFVIHPLRCELAERLDLDEPGI